MTDMNKDLRKRLEEAAKKYADEYVVGDVAIIVDLIHEVAKESFLAGAEYGYKEAIEAAKEWMKEHYHLFEHFDKDEVISDFEADMNKLWEEQK